MSNGVREARARKHWSKNRLAREAGVHVDTITNVEEDRTETRIEIKQAIADALGLERDVLFPSPADEPEEALA